MIKYVLPESFRSGCDSSTGSSPSLISDSISEAEGELLFDYSDSEYVCSEVFRVSGDSPAVFIALKRSDSTWTQSRIGEYAFITFPTAERLTFPPIDGNRTGIDSPAVRSNQLAYISEYDAVDSKTNDTTFFDFKIVDLNSGVITRLGGLEAYTSVRLTWVSDTEVASIVVGSQSGGYRREYTLYNVETGVSRSFDEINIPGGAYIDPFRSTEFYTRARTGDSITRYSIDGQALSTHDFGDNDTIAYSYHFLETYEILLYVERQSTLWTVSTLRLMGMDASGKTWSISSYERIREADITVEAIETQ
jgi:hypothetical protein